MRNGIRINTIELVLTVTTYLVTMIIFTLRVKYILKMESNAGKSIDDYIGSKVSANSHT